MSRECEGCGGETFRLKKLQGNQYVYELDCDTCEKELGIWIDGRWST